MQSFDPLPAFGQLRRHTGPAAMDFGPDVMRDEADDALAVSSGHLEPAVADPFAKPIDPEAPVRVEHDLDDDGVGQPLGNGTSERGMQHA